MTKWAIAILFVVVLLLAATVPVCADSPTLYESFNADDDAGKQIYGNTWAAQTFLTTSAHTVSEIHLLLYRSGTPSTVTVSIRETSDGAPSGADLTSGTTDGDDFTDNTDGAWYTVDVTDYDLENGETYAIVVRAVGGDGSNYIGWRYDNGGGYASGKEYDSSNGGVTWSNVDANDMMFEVWGESVLEVTDVAVFQSVEETGDWLLLIAYKNSYPPYSPGENSLEYFNLEYQCSNTTESLVKCPAWGYKPGAIYIAADKAATLEWGSTSCEVVLIGNDDKFAVPPEATHTMVSGDWFGTGTNWIEDWVLTTAGLIEDHYSDLGVDLELTQYTGANEVLTEQGANLFLVGVPYLAQIVPDIFPFAVSPISPTPETWTGAGQSALEDNLGDTMPVRLGAIGDIFGLTHLQFGGAMGFMVYLVVAGVIYYRFQHGVAAMVLALPVLTLVAWQSLISLALMGVIGSLALLYLAYLWFFRTA